MFNIGGPLPGEEQTNQRAELYAVLHVLRTEKRRVEIRSDSQYVLDGCLRLLPKWRQQGWRTARGRALANADLWKEVYALLQSRGNGYTKLVKVKGHATHHDVENGVSTIFDKIGNDSADVLAVAGAAAHGLPRRERREQLWRIAVTKSIQEMMADILDIRNAHMSHRPDVATQDDCSDTSESTS
eukprot:8849122-Karenia_brevis.AAC.1